MGRPTAASPHASLELKGHASDSACLLGEKGAKNKTVPFCPFKECDSRHASSGAAYKTPIHNENVRALLRPGIWARECYTYPLVDGVLTVSSSKSKPQFSAVSHVGWET